MLEVRRRERFPPPNQNGCCRFGRRTFAESSGNEEDAPKADLAVAGAPSARSPFAKALRSASLGCWFDCGLVFLRLLPAAIPKQSVHDQSRRSRLLAVRALGSKRSDVDLAIRDRRRVEFRK